MTTASEDACQSGERRRLACWQRRPRRCELFSGKSIAARRRNGQARRLRSPELQPQRGAVRLPRGVLAAGLATFFLGLAGQLHAKDNSPIDQLIPWLLNEGQELRGIAFSEVIFDTTGKRVLPIDPKNEEDAHVIKEISAALDETVKRLNAPDNPVQQAARINEVSSHVEDTLRELLNATPGFSCDFPAYHG